MTCYLVKRYVHGGRRSRRFRTTEGAIAAARRALAADAKAVWVFDLATGAELFHARKAVLS